MVLTSQRLRVPACGGWCDDPPGQASQLRRGVVGAQLWGCESWQHYRRIPEARRPCSPHQEDQLSPWLRLAFTMPPTPCDSHTRITPPRPPPATLCLSFHADAAKATKGKREGILPFEVHHAFWDSRGGVEGWQEFLSQLDGLYPEHL